MSVTQVSVTGQIKVVPAPVAPGGLVFALPTGNATTLALGPGFGANNNTLTFVAPVQGIVDAEVPAGVVDGVNGVFTLLHTPNPAGSLKIYRNGLRLLAGGDYTLAGNTVTFAANAQPQPSDPLIAEYRF